MEFDKVIALADVREMQAFAMLSYCVGKMDIDKVQKQVDLYCNNMAISFLEEHKEIMGDREIQIKMYRHISELGANKKHSGHRFYEALYTQMNLAKEGEEEKTL